MGEVAAMSADLFEQDGPLTRVRSTGEPVLRIGGQFVTLSAMVGCTPAVIAGAVGVTVDEYLGAVERWADGPAFTLGVRLEWRSNCCCAGTIRAPTGWDEDTRGLECRRCGRSCDAIRRVTQLGRP
jgi:hypothetical protein